MPEGDNVHLDARRLHAALAGARLNKTDFRVPHLATTDLSGSTMIEVVARGKHILMRTDTGLSIHSHLKMDGEWHILRTGERWRVPPHEVRLAISTDARAALGRRIHDLAVIETAREGELLGHLGPDLLGPDWDAAEALKRMQEHPESAIGDALLDQRIVAGWGNVYRNEICFLRGLDPKTPVAEVSDLAGVIALGKRLIEANREHARHITTGDTRPGRRRYVYGRGGNPCLRCGTRIVRLPARDPERVTYWCPSCQPARTGDRSHQDRAQRP